MPAPATIAPPPAKRSAPPTPDPVVRHGVAQMLTQSEAFRALPPADRKEIAHESAMRTEHVHDRRV